MARAVAFYEAQGFGLKFGGTAACFNSFRIGINPNLIVMLGEHVWDQQGRAIFNDVDAYYVRAFTGLSREFSPRNGSWGERHRHILEPDGQELSFARPI